MIVDIRGHLHGRVPHQLRHGCQVSTVAEHGRREEMTQVVHPDRHLDPGEVTCGIEAFPNRRHRLPPVLDDVRRLALVPHLAQALQKGRRYRDSPKGLRLGRVNPDRGLLEIHMLPAQGEKLRRARACAQVKAHLHRPTDMGFSIVHNPAQVINVDLDITRAFLRFLPPFHGVGGNELHFDPEVENGVHVVAVPIHRGLGPWLSRLFADTLHLTHERNHVIQIAHAFNRRVLAEHLEEHVLEQPGEGDNVLVGPPRYP